MEIHQAGDTVYIQLNTHKSDATPITWAGSPAVAVVKDGGTTTETDGVSLTVDAGTVTGRHIITIDTSQDATFFATGHKFSVIVTAGTVDSVSTVGVIVAEFELGEVPADVQGWNGGAVPTPAEAGAAMTLTEAYDAAKSAAPVGAAMTLTEAYDAAKSAAPSAATVAGAVLDEALGDHDGFLTLLLTAAGYTAPANSDITTLVSRLTATRAGYLDNLTNLDALISSRLAASGYTAPDNDTIALILEDTAALEGRLTALRAGYLDLLSTYLDAAISSRLATSGYTAPQSAAQIQAAALLAIEAYDPPTDTEMDAALSALQTHGDTEWATDEPTPAYSYTNPSPINTPGGIPLSGRTVEIYSNSDYSGFVTSTETDANGYFTIHVSSPGTYYVRVIGAPGYANLEKEITIS